MKKIIIIVSILLISFSNTFASNYQLSSSDKLIVNKLTSKIQKILDSSSLKTRQTLENKIKEIQNQYKNNKKLYNIFEEIKINTHLISYKDEYINHYKENNINFDVIKSNWLNRHNQVRSNLWETLYTFDERLNNTAYEWSKIQSEEKKIMSHKRDSEDVFYDYKKIEKWFNDRWVKCNVAWWATTSESIWKYWYYCNSNDCTSKLDESLKEIFDIYMSEKWLAYPANAHYKWIILPELTKIWIWIRIEQRYDDTYEDYRSYDYYITTHYCTTFKK